MHLAPRVCAPYELAAAGNLDMVACTRNIKNTLVRNNLLTSQWEIS